MVALAGTAPGAFKQNQILKVTASIEQSDTSSSPDRELHKSRTAAALEHCSGAQCEWYRHFITVTVDDGNPIDPTFSPELSL